MTQLSNRLARNGQDHPINQWSCFLILPIKRESDMCNMDNYKEPFFTNLNIDIVFNL